jgi:hypothetical protein
MPSHTLSAYNYIKHTRAVSHSLHCVVLRVDVAPIISKDGWMDSLQKY